MAKVTTVTFCGDDIFVRDNYNINASDSTDEREVMGHASERE